MPRREDHKIREDTWWHLRERYLFRTTGVFKGTQLVALQTAIMLKENVRRKFWDEEERTGSIWMQDIGCGIGSTKGEK